MRKLVTGLGLAFLAIAIVGVHLWREVRTERERNMQLEARVAELQPAQAVLSTPAVTLASVSAPSVAAAPDTPSTAASPAPARSPTSGASTFVAEIQQSLNTPEGQEFTRTMMRMSLELQYADLAKELNLSAEEVGKLLDLLAKQTTDVGTDSANLQSDSTRDRAAREQAARQLAEKEQAYEAEAAALLGSNYPKWKEYQRTAAVRQREAYERQQLDQLRNAVSSSSDPLGDTQFQALNTALAAEQKRIDQDSRGLTMQEQVRRLDESNRRLMDVAAGHLNSVQLERYRRHLEQQQEMARAMMGAMGAVGAQGQVSAGSPP